MAPVRKLLFQLEGIEVDEKHQARQSKFKPQPKP
jgi:hypothetical protein